MRGETDKVKLEKFMVMLGQRVRGEGTIFLTGGATAVLHDWRPATVDVDSSAAMIAICLTSPRSGARD